MFRSFGGKGKRIVRRIKCIFLGAINTSSSPPPTSSGALVEIETMASATTATTTGAEVAKTTGESNDSDLVKNGWLSKWTNYLKGYQKRWFVLQNGVLSYYR